MHANVSSTNWTPRVLNKRIGHEVERHVEVESVRNLREKSGFEYNQDISMKLFKSKFKNHINNKDKNQ